MDASPLPASREDLAQLRHDLKTPLNHILGYSELLEENALESGQADAIPDLKKIQEAARTLAAQLDRVFSSSDSHVVVPPLGRFHHESTPEDPDAAQKLSRPMLPGHLLVVDDNETNRELLGRRLARQGYTFALAENGRQGLEKLRQESFDLLLLDIVMPEMDGYAVLERVKSDENLRHIPVIMISSLDELQSVVRCIAIGADDYLPKPFNPTLLQARISACLEKKLLRDQERRTYLALVESQKRLAGELAEAAAYVKSILPLPLGEGAIRTDWYFRPSTQLGGDAFGYHWLDSSHFALFLLDVSGHGVGAALLSVSAINVLRSQTLPVDFRNPGAVMAAMNNAFQMERQNNMFFSLWYGVFDRRNRELRFATAGHPPAVIFPRTSDGLPAPIRLNAPGMVVGCFPDQEYESPSVEIPPGGRLYLFSDGAYEILRPDGAIWGLDAFLDEIQTVQSVPARRVARILDDTRGMRQNSDFEDDICIVEVEFL